MVGLCRPYIGIKLVGLDKVIPFVTDPPLPEGGRIRLEGPQYRGPPRKRALACRCQVLGPERVDCERITLQSSLNCLNSKCQMELHAD